MMGQPVIPISSRELKSATFISDVHLGIQSPDVEKSKQQELIQTLEWAFHHTDAVFLVGDIFDYWFEYKEVVPRGYTRFFGQLARMTDAGYPVVYFSGNHDFWLGTYFTQELGIETRYDPLRLTIGGLVVEMAHGDGLGPGDHGYKALKWLLTRRWAQWMYLKLHPNWGIGLARWASGTSRHLTEDTTDYGDQERLIIHARQRLETDPYDLFICGHRHVPKVMKLGDPHRFYINLGEWLWHRSYGVLAEGQFTLRQTNGTILASTQL